MRRHVVSGLLAVWILTTASSCQTSFNGGGGSAGASGTAAAVTVAALVVVGGIYCIANFEHCFPDEEAIRARAEERAKAQAAFAAGLRRFRTGDPEGWRWICISAHQGFANAQYLYGVHLATQDGRDGDEALFWLRQAAAQGHREADVILRQRFGEAGNASAEPPPVDPNDAESACDESRSVEVIESRDVTGERPEIRPGAREDEEAAPATAEG